MPTDSSMAFATENKSCCINVTAWLLYGFIGSVVQCIADYRFIGPIDLTYFILCRLPSESRRGRRRVVIL